MKLFQANGLRHGTTRGGSGDYGRTYRRRVQRMLQQLEAEGLTQYAMHDPARDRCNHEAAEPQQTTRITAGVLRACEAVA